MMDKRDSKLAQNPPTQPLQVDFGISLRDYIAAAVAPALIDRDQDYTPSAIQDLAQIAYAIADGMIDESL
jgi:hypothetical protein